MCFAGFSISRIRHAWWCSYFARIVHSHCFSNDVSDLLRCLEEVIICEMRISRRSPVPPVSQEFPDQRQILAGHDGMASHGMPEVVESQLAEPGIFAHRPPTSSKAVLALSIGVSRKEEVVRSPLTGQRLD